MPASYRLRLSDGTLLVVDHDGLSTWLVDDEAMVQLVGSSIWRPLKAFLAGERAAARNASRPGPSAGPALPLIAPPPKAPPSDPEPFFVGEPPAVHVEPESTPTEPVVEATDAAWSAEASRRLEQVLPEEPAPSGSFGEETPLFRDEPDFARILPEEPVVPEAAPVSPPPTPSEAETPIRLKAVDDDAPRRPDPSPWSEPEEQRSLEGPRDLQVLADDVADPHSGSRLETAAADDLPIIRLKARDDRDDDAPEAVRPTAEEPPPWQDPRDEKLFRTVATVGGFLSVWLGRLDRQLGRLASLPREARAPRRGAGSGGARRLAATARGFLSGWMDRLRPPRRLPTISPERPAPKASQTLDAPPLAPSVETPPRLQLLAEETADAQSGFNRGQAPDRALPREPPGPPPPIRELPILRLAEIDEPEVTQDVYDGESPLRTAWLWTKRLVVIGGLLAGAVFAALTWESWLPKAERLSRILFTEIDERARSRDRTERRQRALREATEQLPYLAPDTIELVLSSGALDLPEVFRLASDAADRGLSTLAPGEARDLQALRQQMLDTLRPEERQRVREYDRARDRRVTLPFEDLGVIEVLARAGRAVPPASRTRLQVLSGKAVAAGLVQGTPAASPRPVGN